MSKNSVIGRGSTIPWKCTTDLINFKNLTKGKLVVMGRKTWESLPKKPLPGRANIVMSRLPKNHLSGSGALVIQDFSQVEKYCKENGVEEIFVIGGSVLFESFPKKPDFIYRTLIDIIVPDHPDNVIYDYDDFSDYEKAYEHNIVSTSVDEYPMIFQKWKRIS